MDPRIDKVADVMVNYSTKVRPDDLVMINLYDPLAEPLALAVEQRVLEAGGYPVFAMRPTGADDIFYTYAGDNQLDRANPLMEWLMENIDVRMALRATSNTRELSNAPAEAMARYRRANSSISKTFMERQGTGELRWVLTQHPTHASAQDADMSLREYEDFIYGACMAHLDDPVAYWVQKGEEQQRLVDWLKGKDRVEVRGEHVDLTLSIKGRTFINACGQHNFPDGEIFTGPVEDSVEGWVRFSYPAIYNSRGVEGVELRFEGGRVVEATADQGEDYLNSVLDTDEGARSVGEFAIGTNEGIQQFTRNILFDEKIGGTFHMALGAGYPDTGSTNESAIHWDMICDMRTGGEIVVDGDLFYKDGEFQV